ncbi:hypothetical protein QBC42DRAFT_298828 [Cladorrhinum samala]|uniref:Rhodopsin domain-containing protein n=1 Tax=Cladorrhinum samala TaxID=585594 RepID=A0AAV9HLF3_9PEZI|nr:hypothetical protein QBC42DRAFT_298828 [Cladorrhinum samala]
MGILYRRVGAAMAPQIQPGELLGAMWATTTISVLCLLVRLHERYHKKKLHPDDYWAIFAGILVLASAILFTWAHPTMYLVLNIQAGLEQPRDADSFKSAQSTWLVTLLAATTMFNFSLTSVKLSLLLFFRRLGGRVQKHRKLWWGTLFFVIVIWSSSVAGHEYQCLLGSIDYIQQNCFTESAIRVTKAKLIAHRIVDIASDLLIMAIPILLVWNVQMRWKKKLALLGLFSLSILTIIIALILIVSAAGWGSNDRSFTTLLSTMEPAVGLIISCLSAFPHLFNRSRSKPEHKHPQTSHAVTRHRPPSTLDMDMRKLVISGSQEDHLDHSMQNLTTPSMDNKSMSHTQISTCYSDPSFPSDSVGNGILQKVEYKITSRLA